MFPYKFIMEDGSYYIVQGENIAHATERVMQWLKDDKRDTSPFIIAEVR